MKEPKLQSAMEYLMTYGWAILIIAVVLIGLNYLGIFNSETFAPKASPGACYVLRTAAEVSLAGECNGYIPRSVGQFNGANSYISTGTTGLPLGSAARSVFAWVYFPGASSGAFFVYAYGTTSVGNEQSGLNLQSTGAVKFAANGNAYTSTLDVPTDSWSFIGYNYTAGSDTITVYLNGQSQTGTLTGAEALNTVLSATLPSVIGATEQTLASPFSGSIANVQVYNASLSTSTIQAMYAAGIGGAPINLQNLVAWWPLNGDVNDYSGNGNNGVNNNVVFNPNWYTSYTPA